MLRLTELRLPLEHTQAELRAAVLGRLGIDESSLGSWRVFRRGYDARKRGAIVLVYTIDCEIEDDAAVLGAHAGDPNLRPAPDTTYRFVAHSDSRQRGPRPVVVGFGPCGLFAALILAQSGFR